MHFIDIANASPVPEEATAVPLVEQHTTEPTETADAGVAASLGLNGQLFIFQLINFAIVAAIIWFLILKPLTKKLAERQQVIDESLANTRKVQENLARSERDYQARIDDAKVEALRILDAAQEDGKKLNTELKIQAKKEIETLVEQAKRNIKIEREEVLANIKSETVNLIVAALEKILNEKLDEKKDKKLIEETLKNIKD